MKRYFVWMGIFAWMQVFYAQQKILVDEIAAVVGNEAILKSDIANMRLQLKEQGLLTEGTDDCKLLEMIMKEKMLVAEAKLDTTITKTVRKEDLREQAKQQLEYIKMQAGGLEEALKLYNKNTEKELLDEITEFNYNKELFNAMKRKITEKVEITPDEVKRYFDSIPPDKRPEFSTQVELAQIVIKPKPSEEEVERVKKQLEKIRESVLKGETTFRTQAVLYSQDPGSRANGGLYTIDKNTPFVQEFKDIAFSLDEGEISRPFKTSFGWHILMVEKIQGRKRDIRHILLIPVIKEEDKKKARELLEKIKKRIEDGELTFEEAARNFSEDEETKKRGGLIIDPNTGESLLEAKRLSPKVYAQLIGRSEGALTGIVEETDPTGMVSYKLFKIKKKVPPHKADFIKDYAKISEMALAAKKEREVNNWIKNRLKEAYIYISDAYKKCDFAKQWLAN